MTPYYEHGAVKLYKGDCRAVLREIAPASVALLLTDPPYGIKVESDQFAGGDRTLAGVEFVCAFENLYGETIPNRHARSLMSRLDNGRGTVADLVAVIDRWRNPPPRPPRPKRAKFQPGQMCLGL